MDNCEFFVKKRNEKMPDSDLIMQCHKEFGLKFITLIFNNGKHIFVDKEKENILDFVEDLYSDVTEKDDFIIIFHNEINNYYNDYEKSKLFYRTKNIIGVSHNECNCIDEIINIDKNRYDSLFQMFLHDNSYIEISINSINIYGSFEIDNGYYLSKKVNIEKENITTDNVYSIVKIPKYNKCYLCNNNVNVAYNINKVLPVCFSCYSNLHCRSCCKCNKHFSAKYLAPNGMCLECYTNSTYPIYKYFLENSIGLKYFSLLENPCSKLDFKNFNISDSYIENRLKDKTSEELLELREKIDEWLYNIDKMFFVSKKVSLMMNLQKQILIT